MARGSARRFLICWLLIGVFSGCVSSHQNARAGEVIERSAEMAPPWITGDFSAEKDVSQRFLHFKRSGLFRLELGIKQTQAAAVEQACELIRKRFVFETEAKAKEWNLANPEILEALEKNSAAINEDTCPMVQPKFIYWEKIKKQEDSGFVESYDIHVLLVVRDVEFNEVFARALAQAKKSGSLAVTDFVNKFASFYFRKELN